MFLTDEGTVICKGARKALEDVQAHIWRIRARARDSPKDALARMALEALESEEDAYLRLLDEDVIGRWERTHAQYWTHRRGMEEYAETMRTLAPEYCTAIHRERRRYDVAQKYRESTDTTVGGR